MAECQSRSVERLAGTGTAEQLGVPSLSAGDPAAAPSPVHGIAHHRMPDVFQVRPDLMGSASVKLEPEQVDYVEPGHDKSVGPGGSAVRHDGHALAIIRVPGQRCIDGERTGVEVAPDQRGITAADPAGSESGSDSAMGKIGFRDDHQSGGVSVEAMHDPRTALGTSCEGRAPRDQRIHQRVVPMPRGGMYYQPGRLVEHRQVVVFEDDGEGNGAGLKGARRLGLGKPHAD